MKSLAIKDHDLHTSYKELVKGTGGDLYETTEALIRQFVAGGATRDDLKGELDAVQDTLIDIMEHYGRDGGHAVAAMCAEFVADMDDSGEPMEVEI